MEFTSPDLTGKCGSCKYGVIAENVFGKSKCYVRCTNKEHLQSRMYQEHPLIAVRQRTAKACKLYRMMQMAGKWDYAKQVYEPYALPENCPVYCEDLNTRVRCASCGKEMLYADSRTSMEIHNGMGFGYPVCNECHEKEWERRERYE